MRFITTFIFAISTHAAFGQVCMEAEEVDSARSLFITQTGTLEDGRTKALLHQSKGH